MSLSVTVPAMLTPDELVPAALPILSNLLLL